MASAAGVDAGLVIHYFGSKDLLSAIIHGVIAERYLLRLTHLADASPEQILDLLRPCFQSLTTPPPAKPS